MALGRPELRRVRPATALKTGPLRSSSHGRHGLSVPAGRVYEAAMLSSQTARQAFCVWALL